MIEAIDLSLCRRGRWLVDGVSLRVARGEMLGVVGPNGAGKSTLIRLLAGELAPTRGAMRIDGRPLAVWRPRDLARRRAVLPQGSSLGFPLAAAAVVALGRLPHVHTPEARRDSAAIGDAMRRAGVLHLSQRIYDTLSGGEQQRVQLARVLAQLDGEAARVQGGALLLDEPTTSLDLAHQHAVLRAARDLAEECLAVVAVLHDLNLAAAYCDRALVLDGGCAQAEGPPAAVLTPALLRRVYQTAIWSLPHPCLPGQVVLISG